jgi:hypothetical protein
VAQSLKSNGNIHDGLSGDSLRDNFWFNCKGAMSMNKLSSYTVETAGQYIVKFWYSYKPKHSLEKAHSASPKGTYEKRFCQACSDGKRFRIMKTHNTKDCRIKIDGKSKSANQEEIYGNKAVSNYSSARQTLYHDSGTSRTMINFQPSGKVKDVRVPVFTAGANQPPEMGIGKGSIKFGSIALDLDFLHVPSFSKNLLSATQLSIDHGCTHHRSLDG